MYTYARTVVRVCVCVRLFTYPFTTGGGRTMAVMIRLNNEPYCSDEVFQEGEGDPWVEKESR